MLDYGRVISKIVEEIRKFTALMRVILVRKKTTAISLMRMKSVRKYLLKKFKTKMKSLEIFWLCNKQT